MRRVTELLLSPITQVARATWPIHSLSPGLTEAYCLLGFAMLLMFLWRAERASGRAPYPKEISTRCKISWKDKLLLARVWVGLRPTSKPRRERMLELAGRRYEYFILAAVTWCCCDDAAARLAAITTASATSADARRMMIQYLSLISLGVRPEQQEKVAELISVIVLTAGDQELSLKRKLHLTRALRNTDQEYHRAWKSMYADPEIFGRRHPEIKMIQQAWPQWLHDALYGCARVCPKCHRNNAASAELCDCGHALTDRDCPNFR